MPLGQGWLNAWVKVNSKHVVFPQTNTKISERDSYNRDEAPLILSPAVTKGHGHERQVGGAFTDKSVATAPTATSEDAEHQAIKLFNSRKHKRRLHRTVSASDLIRAKGGKGPTQEKNAALQASDNVHEPQPPASHGTNSTASAHGPSRHAPLHDEDGIANKEDDKYRLSSEKDPSLTFVAGFFGADIERYSGGHGHASAALGKLPEQLTWTIRGDDGGEDSVRESASMQSMERSRSLFDGASVGSRGGQSAPARAAYSSGGRMRKDDSHNDINKSLSGGLGIRFPPNLFAGDNNSKGHCRHCRRFEADLLSSQEDLEYLRGMAIRSEYMCASCEAQPSARADGLQQSTGPTSQKESAQTLEALTARHRNQVEQLTKESARWQQDTHFKLQKFASLCKDLDEEAALRNEEAIDLHHQLDAVKEERDSLATEAEQLRARLAFFERKEKEQAMSELMLHKYEEQGLEKTGKAIAMRDTIINDLSGRLERALDLVQLEREQQRQRRQIIFPSRTTNPDGHELEGELRTTKEALRSSQQSMEAMKNDAEKKEVAWKLRIEHLERQLDAARSN